MTTMLCRIHVKPGREARFEEILRLLVDHTATETECLRYEYWRAQTPCHYYAVLSFTGPAAFYTHQASDYHNDLLPELYDMFDLFEIEYVDPVPGGGSGLPPTDAGRLNDDAPDALKAEEARYPIAIPPWWALMRG